MLLLDDEDFESGITILGNFISLLSGKLITMISNSFSPSIPPRCNFNFYVLKIWLLSRNLKVELKS